MKNQWLYSFLPIFFVLLAMTLRQEVAAQWDEKEFRSEKYAGVISNVVDQSSGMLDTEMVIQHLLGAATGNGFPAPDLMSGLLILSPMIALVSHDGSDSASYIYTPPAPETSDLTIDFSETPAWVGALSPTITGNSITIGVDPNSTNEPRLASFVAHAMVGAVTSTFTAYILQEPIPQKLIYVSPTNVALPPLGGEETFSVTSFNIDEWEAVITDDWVVQGSKTDVSITFSFNPNPSTSFRQATIQIRETGNPVVSDEIAVYQYGGNQPYIIVTPSFITVPPEQNVTPAFAVNTENSGGWRAEFGDDWISVDSSSLTNETIAFFVQENTTTGSRQAVIEILDTITPGISDVVTIFQYTASQSFLIASPKNNYINPEGGELDVLVFSNIEWTAEAIVNPGNMVETLVAGADTLTIGISPNPTANPRTATIELTGGDPLISETIFVYQPSAYILLNPREQVVACVTGIFEVDMIKFGVSGVANSAKPDWVEQVVIGESLVAITVEQNPTEFSRSGYVVVNSIENQLIRDSVQVVQYSCSQPYVLLSPREQIAAWNDTVTENPFVLNANIVNDFLVEASDTWIVAGLNAAKDSLMVSFEPNPATGFRTAQIKVSDASNPSVFDSVSVLQLGVQAYVLISPSFQAVSHEGGVTGLYSVITLNVDQWEVVEENLPPWVTGTQISAGGVVFEIAPNDLPVFRQTSFYVRDMNDHTLVDSAIIYQKAAPAPFLLASPRQQTVLHTGNPLTKFKVSAVNVKHWQADLGGNTWLELNPSGQDELSLNVTPNPLLDTRIAEITIYDTTNLNVADTVTIYQYSALDTLLLASPREQWVGHEGEGSLSFGVAAVNVENWEVETASLPAWIGLESSTLSHFTLNIQPNDSLETRQALVRLFVTGHPDIYDSVFVYQYSALDTFLLAAPREQMISHQGDDNVEFQVTSANVESWQVDAMTVPDWITVTASGDALLGLEVSPNDTLQTRIAQIRIFAAGQAGIEDFVTVYQFAGLDKYLIAAPREQRVAHFGNDAVDFDITLVNVTDWDFSDTAPYDDWINFINLGDTMRLDVSENTTLESRQAQIAIHATDDPSVTDTVIIYQYSALDQYLLAAPREHEVSYTDTTVNFEVTVVNVTNPWEAEIITESDWIQIINSGIDNLEIEVTENHLTETRFAKVRLFASANEDTADTVTIYQYAAPDPFLLIAPREQFVAHTGNENLSYTVTAVNVEAWQADAGAADWITVIPSGQEELVLNVAENSTLETRVATIFITDVDNEEVTDSVRVYQYSALDSYLLAAPREQKVPFSEGAISFHITAVNVSNWILQEDLPGWIIREDGSVDILNLNIQLNETLETRSATIFISAQGQPDIKDSVSIYQLAANDPHILIAPREQKVSHSGDDAVDFDITLVNVDEWEFADTANIGWIDFTNLGNTMRLGVDANDQLQARSANIVIRAVSNTAVKDSVTVYQYSALDQYILMEPREQMAKRYSGDTLYFKATKVNVPTLGFEVFDDEDGMIDTINTALTNDTLAVYVNQNNAPNSRQARIKVFDPDRPDVVSDTVSVYQNFPYIILRPAAVDSLSWSDTVRKINTYSNVAQYTVRKGESLNWYQISKDSLNWSGNSLLLSGNDELFLRVDTNDNAFLRRSSFLKFQINNEIAAEFWFDQNTKDGETFPVGGQVFIQGNPQQPLSGVSVVLYDSILVSDQQGRYLHENVPQNWIGTITPLIDSTLAIPYYFLPARIVVDSTGITDTTNLPPFAAYIIDPGVTLTPKSAAICFGRTLEPGDPDYPVANISDTYGSSTYHWFADPPDSLLAIEPNVLTPKFGPKETTTYRLEVYNFARTATAIFTIEVNPLPENFSFDGEPNVCRNQAGVIYQVPDLQPGVYYKWAIDNENPGGAFANSYFPQSVSGNIAVVNWGNVPGEYKLHLLAFNQFDCAADTVTRSIMVTETEAPPPAEVLRKDSDNMLYSADTLAKSYQWGWLQKNAAGELVQEYIIPDKNQWYCRLPEGHIFDPAVYIYFVIAYYDEESCGSRSFFNVPVGIEDFKEEVVTIFPNPGNGVFTVSWGSMVNAAQAVIEVYNVSGQMIFQQKPVGTANKEIIDLTGVAGAGIYLLTLRTPGQLYSSKIVIQ